MATHWPPLPYEEWEPTKQTVHRYAQILGKIRMALVPARNHWWHVTLYLDARGLTTGLMPGGSRDVEIRLDLIDHRLEVLTSDGATAGFGLRERPACADFYSRLFEALDARGVGVEISAAPYDLPGPPLSEDREHDSYDADAVSRWWTVLRSTQRVFDHMGSEFVGKASPVHLFWHSFDLAHARFSGRPAPVGEVDHVTAEAYSHEVLAFGFWPGDERQTPFPAFYSYTAPEPESLAKQPLEPSAAAWQDTGNGHLAILPYESVREAADPGSDLLAFFRSAYAAGSGEADWDAALLSPRGS